MRNLFLGLGILLAANSFAEAPGVLILPSEMGTLAKRDLGTQTLGTVYVELATSLTNKSKVCIVNGGTAAILGDTLATSCSSATDRFAVPSGGNACFDANKVKGKICIRYTPYSSTTIYGITW